MKTLVSSRVGVFPEILEDRRLMSAAISTVASTPFIFDGQFVSGLTLTVGLSIAGISGTAIPAVPPITEIYNAPGDHAIPPGYFDSDNPAANPNQGDQPAVLVAIASSSVITAADFVALPATDGQFTGQAVSIGPSVQQANYTDGAVGYFTNEPTPQQLFVDTTNATDSENDNATNADIWTAPTEIYNAPGDTNLPGGYYDSCNPNSAVTAAGASPAVVAAITSTSLIPTSAFIALPAANACFGGDSSQLGDSVLQVNYADGAVGYFTSETVPRQIMVDTSNASDQTNPNDTNANLWFPTGGPVTAPPPGFGSTLSVPLDAVINIASLITVDFRSASITSRVAAPLSHPTTAANKLFPLAMAASQTAPGASLGSPPPGITPVAGQVKNFNPAPVSIAAPGQDALDKLDADA